MEFRLTYSGTLLSTGNDAYLEKGKKAEHKHKLRRAFHPQLKRLWEITPHLKNGGSSGPSSLLLSGDQAGKRSVDYRASTLMANHVRSGWSFVPLVSRELELLCSIDVLFLRPYAPGGLVNQGDLDGRLKTLLDALSIPDDNQGYEGRASEAGERPLYVLLEDDSLITKVSVESDQLLQVEHPKDVNEVRLVISVALRPFEMTSGNMQFG